MGVNLVVSRSLPRSPGASGRPVHPPGPSGHVGSSSGSSGRLGCWSTPSPRVLIVNTYKHRGQKCKSSQNCSNKIQIIIKHILTGRS